jgi:hypothetical protein
MKDAPRQQFRSAAHVSGTANVKPKDYAAAAEVEAENEYAAWALLRNTEHPLHVGDLLEALDPEAVRARDEAAATVGEDEAPAVPPAAVGTGKLRICKYVGFEEARWFVPEPPPQTSLPAPLSGEPPVAATGTQAPPAGPSSRTNQAQA